ncbi:MAG: membrane protein insertion efficiency factor YidD [Thermoanaerobaculia bacterium]|nr:membrane protein insertion efficiency factor YidD [Thermoanaerobaculia bacterium]
MNSVPAPENLSSDARRDRRAVVLAIAILFAPLVVHDLFSPPSRDWSVRAAVTAIHGYQRWISPFVGVQCRFKLSCSRYGERAIEKHGFVVGSAKTAWRIIRCNPFTKKGTVDEP